jgi:hypothetical protein
MLGIIVLMVFIGGALIALFSSQRGSQPSRPQERTMLYAPGSEDVAAAAYHPARKDGAMPFPLGKRKERKKTETFQNRSKK